MKPFAIIAMLGLYAGVASAAVQPKVATVQVDVYDVTAIPLQVMGYIFKSRDDQQTFEEANADELDKRLAESHAPLLFAPLVRLIDGQTAQLSITDLSRSYTFNLWAKSAGGSTNIHFTITHAPKGDAGQLTTRSGATLLEQTPGAANAVRFQKVKMAGAEHDFLIILRNVK